MPHRSNTRQGALHKAALPIKLARAQNDAHKCHEDARFAKCTVDDLDALAVQMGKDCVAFISRDDKAKVALALPAANKQAPILMHMEHKVRLSDHNFPVAPKHQLIPSVYGACVIENGK